MTFSPSLTTLSATPAAEAVTLSPATGVRPDPGRGCTVVIETMGCKLNLADSEVLARDFSRLGFEVIEPPPGTAEGMLVAPAPVDVYILNTCTVTHVADRKARQQLRNARRRFPNAYVVATGCYPARASAEVAALPEVDLVTGNDSKPELAERVVRELIARTHVPHVPTRTGIPPHRTRAFVKIQEGCNDYCSYCIIPKTRGSSRSFPPQQILAELRQREREGYREVVLTGTQLGDYGIPRPGSRRIGPDQRDQATEGNPLARLIALILQETGIPRIRLSSIQPQDVTEPLLALWWDPRLCPHFHLPLQSGSNAVLRRMRRRYTAGEFLAAASRIRAAVAGVSITTDIIAGFPGETEEDFEHTMDLAQRASFADIHVFPYSPRAGTLGTRLDRRVPDLVKQERARRLLALAQRARTAHRSRFIGATRPVLWEEQKNGVWTGLTDNYLRVYSPSLHTYAGLIEPLPLTPTAFAPPHLVPPTSYHAAYAP